MLCRQHQHLQHHNWIIGWATALGTVRIGKRGNQRRTERVEIHHPRQHLQRIAVSLEPLHVVR